MAVVSREITVKGKRWLFKNFARPADGQFYLNGTYVATWAGDSGSYEYLIVEEPPKVWRVPTDEDAKFRPVCRYRDNEPMEWQKGTLLYVTENGPYPFIVINKEGFISWFRYCEIECEE